MGSRWAGVKCPVCGKPFAGCPHSVAEKDAKEADDALRATIRDEVSRLKKRGLL